MRLMEWSLEIVRVLMKQDETLYQFFFFNKSSFKFKKTIRAWPKITD